MYNTNNPNEVEKLINNQWRYFKFYMRLPLISALLIFVPFLIAGFAMASESGAGAFFLSLIIGAIIALIVFVILKITYSYNILHMLQLQKLNNNIAPQTPTAPIYTQQPQQYYTQQPQQYYTQQPQQYYTQQPESQNQNNQ